MMIDVQSYLDAYTDNIDEVLKELKQHQIITVSNSVDLDSYALNCEIANRSKLVIPIFGIHPINASKYASDLSIVNDALESSPLIGEIGLDFTTAMDDAHRQDQITIFEYLLEFASTKKRYVILSSKEADIDVLRLIEKHNIQKVIISNFTGTQEIFEKMINRGIFFTLGADILSSNNTKQLAKDIPEDQLLIGTGNPGISTNQSSTMPQVINDIVKELAHQRNRPEKDIVRMVERNFLSILQSNRSLAKFSKKIARDFKNRRGSRTL